VQLELSLVSGLVEEITTDR